jgi:hypothetical protein
VELARLHCGWPRGRVSLCSRVACCAAVALRAFDGEGWRQKFFGDDDYMSGFRTYVSFENLIIFSIHVDVVLRQIIAVPTCSW